MEGGKNYVIICKVCFLLQSDWKYNFILICIILQVEIVGKFATWELLYDFKNYYRWSPGGLSWQTIFLKAISDQIICLRIILYIIIIYSIWKSYFSMLNYLFSQLHNICINIWSNCSRNKYIHEWFRLVRFLSNSKYVSDM